MKTLYFECAMGAAGDMLMGALYELCPEKEKFLRDMNALIPGVALEAEPVRRQGIAGTHMRVVIHGQEEGHHHHDHDHGHPHHHEHRSLTDIESMIDGFALPQEVRGDAKKVYALIARAESAAHGTDVGEVHFHEVGALDAVMDVTGVCYLMRLLAADAVCASPVAVGSGTVHTAHGVLPVPAPATARLLTGVPVTAGDIAAELCTPTGAALLRTFVESWGPMPDGAAQGCGYGCGTKEFPRANCVRAFLIDSLARAEGPNDEVTELKANIDDMTGEALGFAMERLLEAGALDVSYAPVYMKKDRPGVVLACLCRAGDADRLAKEILEQTSTFGVRRTDCVRYALEASGETVETVYGAVPKKVGRGYGIVRSKPEYEALAGAAREHGVSLETVRAAYERGQPAPAEENISEKQVKPVKETILSLAAELRLPEEVLSRLEAAADALPPDLPVSALAFPETAEAAWAEAAARLPAWEADDGMSQLAVVLAVACETREQYRENGISDEIFLATMGCLPRFLEETKAIRGRTAFDRGFWTWRQTGCRLFRLGTLEFEYGPSEQGPCPWIEPGDPSLHVHVPSDASLTREALDDSYARARRFFTEEGAVFCGGRPPRIMVCESWLLAPALDGLLPEGSGIRRFAGDYERFRVEEDDTSFYRWLFQKPGPAPLEELPDASGLQRAVKARLAAGGTIGGAWGVLREEAR